MTVRAAVVLTVLGLVLAVAGCGSENRPAGEAESGPAAAGVSLPNEVVGHVVIFWLKEPGNAEDRRQLIEASETFRSVPGVLAVQAGEKVASPRRNVDQSYDVAVVIWFRDRDALERYQTHPAHLSMLTQVGPLVDRTVVYDFINAIAARQ